MRLGVLATHPIQYHAPLYRSLARELDLQVYFAHQQSAEGQAKAGFGVAFEWDVPLLDGYEYQFLENRAKEPRRRASADATRRRSPDHRRGAVRRVSRQRVVQQELLAGDGGVLAHGHAAPRPRRLAAQTPRSWPLRAS